jgi:hypothetical protein
MYQRQLGEPVAASALSESASVHVMKRLHAKLRGGVALQIHAQFEYFFDEFYPFELN